MVTVRVPATSANLGAGFDALGLAVNLYNEMSFEEADRLVICSNDDVCVPLDESNLIYVSAKYLYDYLGKELKGLTIHQTNNIPLARGLGSSSACIVGGLVGANALLGNPLSNEELLTIATKIEGHPDNVAPALLGGLVTAVLEGDQVFYVKQDLKEDLNFVVIVPDQELKTSVARQALPKEVSHKDACYNLSRSALMVQSLSTGKYENLRSASGDKLHQPYRFPHIPFAEGVIEQCYQFGSYAAMISGAGSALLAMVEKDNEEIVRGIRDYLDLNELFDWKVTKYQADNVGAVIL